MKGLNVYSAVGIILLIVGGLNWGLVGIFDFDLVAFLFGEMTPLSRIVYILVGVAAVGIGFWLPAVAATLGWQQPRTPTSAG